MKTNLEVISPVKKKLVIEIESSEVDKRLNGAYREVGKSAKIPGFRPGKIPKNVLKNYYGSQILENVTQDIINDSFPKAIEETEIFPIGAPMLEKNALREGENYTYSAEMEVRPEFEVKDYLDVEVEKEKSSFSEKDVEKRIEEIRKANGKLNSITEDRPIGKDDHAVFNYQGFEDEKPLEDIKADNFMVKVGSGDFHPKFENSLIGFKKEDKKTITVDFEEDFYHSKLAGKSVTFEIEIVDIKEMELPELTDEFAKSLSDEFENIEILQEKVKETLISEEKKRIDSELKQRLIRKISDDVDIDLPSTLVDSEINFAIENVKQNLLRSGSDIEKAGLSEKKLREDFRPSSERRVKDSLILSEISKNETITVDEEEVAESFKKIAGEMGQDPETIRRYYEARDLMGSLNQSLIEEKTLNYLVENANITEVDKDKLTKDSNLEQEKK